jgi:hypothetical protein
MRKLFMIAAAAAGLMAVNPASAQYYYFDDDYYVSPSPPVIISADPLDCDALREVPNFHGMDRNADGHVSKMEFMHLGTLDEFVSLDLNSDRVLSRGEINEYRRLCD